MGADEVNQVDQNPSVSLEPEMDEIFNSSIDDAAATEAQILSLLRHVASLEDDRVPIWSLSAADTRKVLHWAQRGCKSYLDWAIDVKNPKGGEGEECIKV